MPKLLTIKTPEGDIYKYCSMYGEEIEKVKPSLWLGAYKYFQLTQIAGFPKYKARIMTSDYLSELANKQCPDFLRELFLTNKKKEQEQLLRDKSITIEDLDCCFLYAESLNGLFSQYSYEDEENVLNERAPLIIDISNPDDIKTVGKTDLSEASLLHLVETQKKKMAQFVDFEDGRWFCFYRTYRGLAGKESGEHGQHLHFISNAYGVSRDALVADFRRCKCSTKGFHIHLNGYGIGEKNSRPKIH